MISWRPPSTRSRFQATKSSRPGDGMRIQRSCAYLDDVEWEQLTDLAIACVLDPRVLADVFLAAVLTVAGMICMTDSERKEK
jgi:hypothetical protein